MQPLCLWLGNCHARGSLRFSSVLRALNLKAGDTILYLSTAYSMVVNTLEYLQQREELNLVKVQIDFPTTTDAIVQAVQEAIAKEEEKGYVAPPHFKYTVVDLLLLEQKSGWQYFHISRVCPLSYYQLITWLLYAISMVLKYSLMALTH